MTLTPFLADNPTTGNNPNITTSAIAKNDLNASNNAFASKAKSSSSNATGSSFKVNNIQPTSVETGEKGTLNQESPHSSNSTLGDRLAPTGDRTEHHPNDHKDFNQPPNM
nr:hypothetical protein BaRGS_006717 [Batillaria attramentaria]